MQASELTDYHIKALAMARDRKQGREPTKAMLANERYLVRVPGGYRLTDKGRAVLQLSKYCEVEVQASKKQNNKTPCRRKHQRRGHWRNHPTGKKIWIREFTVNEFEGMRSCGI